MRSAQLPYNWQLAHKNKKMYAKNLEKKVPANRKYTEYHGKKGEKRFFNFITY